MRELDTAPFEEGREGTREEGGGERDEGKKTGEQDGFSGL